MERNVKQRKGKKHTSGSKPSVQPEKSASERSAWSKRLTACAVMATALGIVVYLLPSPVDPVPLYLPSPPVLEGPLAPNTLLQGAERLLEGKVFGPEALEMRDGAVYTGTGDGQVVKIENDQITTIARFGSPPCGLQKDEHRCGRPLGLRFHSDGFLYVLDAYLGLFKVNVETGDTTKLLSGEDPIGGKPMKFLNDLDIDSDGVIYFSDSSYRWQRRQNRHAVLENTKTARVFKFDPKTGEKSVILDDLCFANGIQLSPDEDFLLITETTYAQVKKYYLKGPKKGQVEVFADNLPGLVDNIRPRRAGGYWVGMATVRKQPISVYDIIAARPWLSKLITKFISPEWIVKVVPKHSLVIALDEDGNIIESLHDTTGRNIPSVSSVLDTGEHLYFGSYHAEFLGRLSLK
ncbi:adipocyte plasma membrane-associated protein-like [Acanthaster planci]|uniref:Adipocyte plasma membrane-associated protein-like n=1 Tax=Acanthaster planci TaxID=133434 RepID=A0A8B7XQF8_ACAPL|nr:adipocyte plasma membrane-associated protein-like [Acanthaster planci]XP_022083060.1 adipocyte plasma membrane-associated protein-like [Acanthaster planci]XP_022083061.1 adipocyte plasma membrane-associated protein-like [Acanthaster planci]